MWHVSCVEPRRVVKAAAPNVNVQPPPAPNVNVEPPTVNVQPPNVNVNPPAQQAPQR